MTGRYPSHTGIGPGVIPPNAPYGMPKEETLLPQVLGAVGYRTAALGKVRLRLCVLPPPFATAWFAVPLALIVRNRHYRQWVES